MTKDSVRVLRKTLFLFRHAKSSWQDPLQVDRERPLNDRGRRAAQRMGRFISHERIIPDLVLCSTSVRTRETARLAFAELATVPPTQFLDELYHATAERIADVIAHVTASPSPRTLMILGHNPGLEEFLLVHTGTVSKFPTAALAEIDFAISDWNELPVKPRGSLRSLWKPKQLFAE